MAHLTCFAFKQLLFISSGENLKTKTILLKSQNSAPFSFFKLRNHNSKLSTHFSNHYLSYSSMEKKPALVAKEMDGVFGCLDRGGPSTSSSPYARLRSQWTIREEELEAEGYDNE
ncbi:hypothetical protein PanWU01x14_090140 [Parasponia andersonii]|uniref:Uncharacterized protein n=1 Tax=Parasponia andersonii TaxID=3476 RepID=A0A2P5D7M2_PARAD|nr:hypothetical protein PanWU01x14_090140 [Parasponia andersonii]